MLLVFILGNALQYLALAAGLIIMAMPHSFFRKWEYDGYGRFSVMAKVFPYFAVGSTGTFISSCLAYQQEILSLSIHMKKAKENNKNEPYSNMVDSIGDSHGFCRAETPPIPLSHQERCVKRI
ncbi:hypothetical protein ACFL4W_05000 [Planctomycetota bacterium]